MIENIPSVSIVIPVFNEAGSILELHREILEICIKEAYRFEIIVVDDGSTDDTDAVAGKLSPVKYIRLRKNFGQTSAMDAGIKAARCDYIITMDGDGQNDPADIPNLIRYMQEKGLDVVSGWRVNRKDKQTKKFVSRGANFLRSLIINDVIHDSGCSLKVYKRECFENITLYGEMHRFIPEILKIKGFSIGELPVNHRPRTQGYTKYNWKRMIKGFLDLISVWFWNKYAVRPLHLLGGLGLILLILGFASGIATIYQFLNGGNMSDTAYPLLTSLLLISGFLMIIAGLLADMLSKIYYGRANSSYYSIRHIIENK